MGYVLKGTLLFITIIPIYLFVLCIRIFLSKRSGKEISFKKELLRFIFTFYALAVVGVTLLPITIYVYGSPPTYDNYISVNYVPFTDIAREISQMGQHNFSVAFQIKLMIRNVGGNFILLMPMGMLLPLLTSKVDSIKKSFILGLMVSLCIEILQFLENYSGLTFGRIVDIDDLILNSLGAAVGYCIYIFVSLVISKYKNSNKVLQN
ncbi:VanZ family protein [Clostridium yunnanense]|nr:VanZ family protein [Clostridium yunnanense]